MPNRHILLKTKSIVLSITGDWIGVLHVSSSILAMLFGGWVLVARKGTKKHKLSGYLYALNMLIVLVTALFIYRLFGKFGPFHYIAVVGFIYLMVGLLPAFFRSKNWVKLHVYCMYWSVVGLYAAFFAEIAVRLPGTEFWWMVFAGSLIVTILGGIAYGKHKKRWVAFDR